MKINPSQLGAVRPLKPGIATAEEQLAGAKQLKDAYTDFVGKTFFGQMMKAMRSTVGKPAYFHGGQGEEVFRSQLDQQMADYMSDASADQISEPMFRQQFPRQWKMLAEAEGQSAATMGDLSNLRRR
jgi:peptidoglycan hydrolase FlgJ